MILKEAYNWYLSNNPNTLRSSQLNKVIEIYFTWQQTYDAVQKLSDELSLIIKNQDRCLLISENRPEWLISDLAIMLSGGITVPAYTTYTESDYEYLINDCKPSYIIIR